MSVTGLVGITVFPALTSRFRQDLLGAGVSVLIGLGTAVLLLPSALMTTVAALAFGLGSGGSLGLALTFIGLRTRDEQDAASLSGMAQTWGYLISAAGPVAVGAINETTGGWTVPTLAIVAIACATTVYGWQAGRDRLVGGRTAGSATQP